MHLHHGVAIDLKRSDTKVFYPGKAGAKFRAEATNKKKDLDNRHF